MPDLEKLKERQKKLEQQRRAITARIRKAQIEARNGRSMDAAKELSCETAAPEKRKMPVPSGIGILPYQTGVRGLPD